MEGKKVIWILALVVALIAVMPLVDEWRRLRMDHNARATAPGEFATLSQGITHYQWIGPLRGPIAVCVHGLTTPSFVWHSLAKGLALMGYRVLIYDLYGRGYSDRPRGAQNRAFFLRQLDDLLEDQQVTDDFLLIGYSMGGAIATSYAGANPGRVRQLVLLASAGLIPLPGGMLRFVKTIPLLGDWVMYASYPRTHRRGTEAERDLTSSVTNITDMQQRELDYRGFVPAVLASLRGVLNEDLSADYQNLHRIGVPVLAIWGRDDTVVPIAAMGHLVKISRSIKHEVIQGAGHGLAYTHTKDVLKIISDNHRTGLN